MNSGSQGTWLEEQVPIDLNFAMYVASAFHILPEEPLFSADNLWAATAPIEIPAADRASLVQEWRNWWQQMVNDHTTEFSQEYLPRRKHETFQSPHFTPDDQFRNLPHLLKTCCNTAFMSFHTWWTMPTGGNTALRCLGRQVVDQAVQAAGEGTPDPPEGYRFTIDHIYTGIADHVIVSPTYVIMSVLRVPISSRPPSWLVAKIRGIQDE